MNSLFILYSALAVFGVGVTIVDLFGVFEHAGHDDGASGGHDDGASDGHDDGASGGHDDGASGGHDDGASGGHDDGEANGHDDGEASPGAHDLAVGHGGDRGSYVASANAGTRFVARTIGALRTSVYFSLGAGPTGLFAVLTGVRPAASLVWSAGAGIFIAVLARALRAFIRKDLDSSITPAEYIMDEAEITVPVAPGAMGKAVVRRYGKESELYVRAKDPAAAMAKGTRVRIVDYDDDCYWVEAP